MTSSWAVVVPVKRLVLAKSRLSSYGDAARQRLAGAFAADVVAAALQAPGVTTALVVTDDADAARALTALGARVVADDPDAGLNPALEHGVRLLRAEDPELGVAALSADLPCLRSEELAAVLGEVAPGSRAFVADHAGTGTTLLAAGPGASLDPAYGAGSRAAHLASGARALTGGPGLRHDVDTPDDLRAAVALGVGRHTAEVVAGLELTGPQATVRDWDPVAGGSAFLDDGTVVLLPPDALQDSGFRFLRLGQRVRLVLRDGALAGVALPV